MTTPPDDVAPGDGVQPGGALPDDVAPDDVAPDDVAPDEVAAGGALPDDLPAQGDDVPAPAPRPARVPGAWHVLAHALSPRVTRAQLFTALLCGLLGFAVVAQVRQTHGTGLSTLRQSELVGILDQTTRQADDLQDEARQLERTRQQLESGSTSLQAAVDTATRSAATQGILTGRLPAEGPGIEVTLSEPDGTIRALTLLNVLEELRNAGAEAVQLNDLRLTASSYFVTSAEGVVVDGTTLEAPYTWLAIGDPDTMSTALDIPGGALASVRNDGGRGFVASRTLVQIAATRDLPAPVHATPVVPDAG